MGVEEPVAVDGGRWGEGRRREKKKRRVGGESGGVWCGAVRRWRLVAVLRGELERARMFAAQHHA